MTVKDYKALAKKEKRSKYGNKKVVIDGYEFDSQAEGTRYVELKLLLSQGLIRDLELQPEFLLQEGFGKDGKKIRPIIYIADFKYVITATGKTVVEDVKGKKTDVYTLKKKLFEARYPELKITEVRK